MYFNALILKLLTNSDISLAVVTQFFCQTSQNSNSAVDVFQISHVSTEVIISCT